MKITIENKGQIQEFECNGYLIYLNESKGIRALEENVNIIDACQISHILNARLVHHYLNYDKCTCDKGCD